MGDSLTGIRSAARSGDRRLRLRRELQPEGETRRKMDVELQWGVQKTGTEEVVAEEGRGGGVHGEVADPSGWLAAFDKFPAPTPADSFD